MKILVTGGAGFIGSHLVEDLLLRGHTVRVLCRESDPENLKGVRFHPALELIEGDLVEGVDWKSILPGIQLVYHLQWGTLPRKSPKFLSRDLENTLIIGLNMLDACVEYGVQKVIFPSSGGAVYGLTTQDTIDETHPTFPISSYGLTKLVFEKYLHLYQFEYGLDYLIFRISNAYGPRQNLHRPQGVISHWLYHILRNGRVEVWGDGSVVRDYIYIGDVISGLLYGLDPNVKNEIFNLGSGVGFSLNDILEALRNALHLEFEVTYSHQYHSDVPRNVLHIGKITESLGWRPATGLEEGLLRCFEYLSQKYA